MGSPAFLSPWLLVALALLPALWWLLRITPPAAKRLRFPAARLLLGLSVTEETPARTPLWLAMLRLALAALVVLALAHPVMSGAPALAGRGTVLLVVDDGWAAAPDWSRREAAMAATLEAAEREHRAVALLTTAAPESGDPIAAPEPLPATEARRAAQALKPKPWPSDRGQARTALEAAGPALSGATVLWIADGIEHDAGGSGRLAEALLGRGPVRMLLDERAGLPLLMAPPEREGARLRVRVLRPARADSPPQTVVLRGLDADGRVLATQSAAFAAGGAQAQAALDLPAEIANEIVRLDIEGLTGAGSVFLLDERWRRRSVGLVAGAPEAADRPLVGELYYVKRALAPSTEVRVGSVADLLAGEISAIMLADGAGLAADDVAALETFLARGGVVVRFAGPKLAQAAEEAAGPLADPLIPVSLRRGGRALGGVMSWTAPMPLAPFEPESPFAGLRVPDDVRIERQVLAEPSLDLGAKTWAQLPDGTPLVTAERRGEGWLVLFHVTANAEWSNLPLSGLFVEMLERLTALGRGAAAGPAAGLLPPLQSLDGFGRLSPPLPAAVSFSPAADPAPAIGPAHPPGFYGSETSKIAVNLPGAVTAVAAMSGLPPGIEQAGLAPAPAFDFKPWLWLAAFLLLLVDVGVSLALRGLLPRLASRFGSHAAGLALLFAAQAFMPHPAAAAAAADAAMIAAASQTRLAYVRTGEPKTDETSRAGLSGLTYVVTRRTAAELGEPVAVNIETDPILFFPLLYWPVGVEQAPLSEAAAAKVNRYLATGGIILFDTGDGRLGSGGEPGAMLGGGGEGAARLRALVEGLDIPRLAPIPADHVLTKSYYLLDEFPGRWTGGTLWVEAEARPASDGVSPVIVGGNDWAAAWALDETLRPLHPVVPGGAAQREYAFRFGINLVMYALTGNYKADQVHVPAILERLGR